MGAGIGLSYDSPYIRLFRCRGTGCVDTANDGGTKWQSQFFIGATASLRGGPRTAAFAPAKAAQRSLAESMARTLWPTGIHVALIVIDAVVDLPRTRQNMPDKPDEFFLAPDDMATSAVWLAKQPRSAWSFEIGVRPFGEKW